MARRVRYFERGGQGWLRYDDGSIRLGIYVYSGSGSWAIAWMIGGGSLTSTAPSPLSTHG